MGEDVRKLQLEIGGSYFELIEFSLTRRIRGRVVKGRYGVNVAKVREVVRMPKINPLASRIKGVAGVFELRGIPIPAVQLSVALGDDEIETQQNQQIIVTEFSMKRAGFVVDTTHRIRRVAWDKVLPPSADAGTCINGMTLVENNEFLFILDLERILISLEYGVNPATGAAPAFTHPMVGPYNTGIPSGSPAPMHSQPPAPAPTGPRLLLVDDSKFIRNGVKQALVRSGFRVTEAGDGVEAYTMLEQSLSSRDGMFEMMITDVEMPRMDGLSLTKKVRDNPEMASLPIVLHTSLSGQSNQAAGNAVGANGYVIKNDLRTLFELINEILGSEGHAASA